jgi:hypothetical protein
MKLIIPVSYSDFNVVRSFIESIKFFGENKKHNLLVVSSLSSSLLAYKILNEVGFLFEKADVYIFEECVDPGWPFGPNLYFKKTCIYLNKIENTDPWLWMEPDSVPVGRGWLNKIEREYLRSGKLFLGEKKIVPLDSPMSPGKEFVSGTAVYPPDLLILFPLCLDFSLDQVAFDVYIGNFTIPNYAESRLIKNLFRTQKYKLSNDGGGCFVGECADGGNSCQLSLCPRDPFVFVHGCKDSSLFTCLSGIDFSADSSSSSSGMKSIPVYLQIPKCASTYIRRSMSALAYSAGMGQKYCGVVKILFDVDQRRDLGVNDVSFADALCLSDEPLTYGNDYYLSMEISRFVSFCKNKGVVSLVLKNELDLFSNSLARLFFKKNIAMLQRAIGAKFNYFTFLRDPLVRAISLCFDSLSKDFRNVDPVLTFERFVHADSVHNDYLKIIFSILSSEEDFSVCEKKRNGEFNSLFYEKYYDQISIYNLQKETLNGFLHKTYSSCNVGQHVLDGINYLGLGTSHMEWHLNSNPFSSEAFSSISTSSDVLELFKKLNFFDYGLFQKISK